MGYGIQKTINLILALMKWPVALAMVVLLIPAIKTDVLIINDGLTLEVLTWFFLPLLFMIILWLVIPGLSGLALSIFEHEATHMLFAILTFHSPQNITIRRGVGGNFIFTGRGNWLIFIAPYFFPTSAALVIAAGIFYTLTGQIPPSGYWLVLGLMTGYHLISTLDEIHIGQTDFKVAGYLFSILFLPGANILIYGLLMAYACYGFQGWPTYLRMLAEQTGLFISIFS